MMLGSGVGRCCVKQQQQKNQDNKKSQTIQKQPQNKYSAKGKT